MRKKQIFWGVFFILLALLPLTSQLGWSLSSVNPFTIIATIFLVAIIVENLVHFSIGGIIFPVAFLTIIYRDYLGISGINPWAIIGSAIPLTIGFSIIFQPRWARNDWTKHHGAWHHSEHSEEISSDEDSEINIENDMGRAIRYVQSADLKNINVRNYMGATKIFLDKAVINEHATLKINCHLGGIELYIPREWNVTNDIDSFMSGIDEKGSMHTQDGPTLHVTGKLYMSGLTIQYT